MTTAAQQREGMEVVGEGDATLNAGEQDLTNDVLNELPDDVPDESDSNIDAGYLEAMGREPQRTEPVAKTGKDGAAAQAPARGQQQQPPTSTQPPVKIGRWTEEEVAQRFDSIDAVKKTAETLAGTLGSLQQRMSAKPRQLAVKDLPKVVENFGEDFAQALVDDLNAQGFGGPTGGVSQEEINALVATQVSAREADLEQRLEQKIEYKAVKRRHPDADDFFNRPGADGKPVPGKHAAKFFEWVGTLSKDEQQQILTSWDRDVVGGFLDRFKQHAGMTKAPTKEPAGGDAGAGAGPVTSLAQRRASRLRAAETPRSSGAAARPAGEDPVDAGYWEARGGRPTGR